MRSSRVVVALLASLCSSLDAGQVPEAPTPVVVEPRPRSPYFSGFVTDLKPDSIVVSRKTSNGKSTIEKVFVIDLQTKVEGKLKLKSRVTVRFEALGDKQRAIHVIVR